MPPVFGSSTNTALAARLGLSRPQYEGITGLAGVLHVELDRLASPCIVMRVGVPHYATGADNPKAAMALLRNLEHVTGVPTGHAELGEIVDEWERQLDEAVADDADARSYIPRLEAHFDRQAEDQIPTPDPLAEEFERFLQDPPDDEQPYFPPHSPWLSAAGCMRASSRARRSVRRAGAPGRGVRGRARSPCSRARATGTRSTTAPSRWPTPADL